LLPWEKSSTVTSVLPSATGLGVSFPIWLNCIPLWALDTFPLLLTMFSAKMLLDSCQVPKSPWWIMVYTIWFRAHIHLLPYLLACSLLQLPWQVVPSSMKLKILISLKPLVADLTQKSICRHQSRGWQSYHFCIWV